RLRANTVRRVRRGGRTRGEGIGATRWPRKPGIVERGAGGQVWMTEECTLIGSGPAPTGAPVLTPRGYEIERTTRIPVFGSRVVGHRSHSHPALRVPQVAVEVRGAGMFRIEAQHSFDKFVWHHGLVTGDDEHRAEHRLVLSSHAV